MRCSCLELSTIGNKMGQAKWRKKRMESFIKLCISKRFKEGRNSSLNSWLMELGKLIMDMKRKMTARGI